MKRILCLVCAALLLAACAPAAESIPAAPSAAPTATAVTTATVAPSPTPRPSSTSPLVSVTLYVPNADANGLTTISVLAVDTPRGILTALYEAGVLLTDDFGRNITFTQGIEPTGEYGENDEKIEANVVWLDLSDAFGRSFAALSREEEDIRLHALADTFISHYGADALKISIEGASFETRNGLYENAIRFGSYDPER